MLNPLGKFPPPVRRPIDENGVDVIRGTFNTAKTDVTIGPDARRGFAFTRFRTESSDDFNNTLLATIVLVGNQYVVTLNGQSDSFTSSGSSFISTEGNGATLVSSLGFYIYTSRDGVIATFRSNQGFALSFFDGELARLSSVKYPDGTSVQYFFVVQTYCPGGYESRVCTSPIYYVARLNGVHNSNGYTLKLSYENSDTTLRLSKL